jgi:hypothetical protein
VKQLDNQETQLGSLRKELESLTTQHAQAQSAFNAFVAGLVAGMEGPGL